VIQNEKAEQYKVELSPANVPYKPSKVTPELPEGQIQNDLVICHGLITEVFNREKEIYIQPDFFKNVSTSDA